ncbi:hypothetical protein ACFL01_02465 [Planctomycetota bacterium]
MNKRPAVSIVLFIVVVQVLLALGLYVHRAMLLGEVKSAKKDSAILRLRVERGREEVVIRRRVEDIRKLHFKWHVPSRVMKREDIKGYVLKKLAETYSEKEIKGYELSLKLFGAISEHEDIGNLLTSIYESQAGGFYDYHTKILYRIAGSPLRKAILAHEYTHALQDQQFGMSNLPLEIKENDDRALAALSVVEGDAMLVTSDFILRYPDMETVLGTVSSAADATSTEVLRKAPAFIREIIQFPYLKGTAFADLIRTHGGWEAMNALYERPPASTEQILHPEKYIGEMRDDPQSVEVAITLARLQEVSPEAWERVHHNVMGEYAVYVLLRARASRENAAVASHGWDGDRYATYAAGDKAVLSWTTVWDSVADAKEFLVCMSFALEAELGVDTASEALPTGAAWIHEDMCAAISQADTTVHLLKSREVATLRALLPYLGMEGGG